MTKKQILEYLADFYAIPIHVSASCFDKDYIITLLGYTDSTNKHTNWFPWNRFKDVFETIGYKCEWTELKFLKRENEKRIFITWNEPTSLQLYRSGKIYMNGQLGVRGKFLK